MKWIQRHRIREYLKDSIWILPSVGLLAALGVAPLVHRLDIAMGWQSSTHPAGTQAVLITLASAMFTFVVFVSSILLVALQLASAQLTPRIIGIVFRDPFTKLAMMLFTFAFSFAVAAAVRIDETVPLLTTRLAVWACIASLGVFFCLIGHVGTMLRPSEVLRGIGVRGRRVIESVYPRLLNGSTDGGSACANLGGEWTCTIPAGKDGVLLACDVVGMVAQARRADCVIELVPQVGDFVAKGSPLFNVYSDASRLRADELCHRVAIGHERSIQQDPAFVFRIIVDIGCKALSPAINDPTTAVLAIDQLQHLLRLVGRRSLADERVKDETGRTRLIYRTPNWEDFVVLAVTEIRQFGGDSIQIARRLRGMLENLIEILPEQRGLFLRRQLDLLRRSAERHFVHPEDLALAAVGDSQGVGGKSVQARHDPAAPRGRAPSETRPEHGGDCDNAGPAPVGPLGGRQGDAAVSDAQRDSTMQA